MYELRFDTEKENKDLSYIRLPASAVRALNLREGDDIEI
ncbi:MAG: AbrB/MazE/SpoVT family DNA-binding domain-containing protein [Desulfobacteraceae bacterium]|jgi:hypothetical protein